jgi:pimeloyl-ACP methyl ester carboxylesterase
MIKKVTYKNTFIRYSEEGEGDVIVLLHGYLECLEVWQDFAAELSRNYKVIIPDMPSHGQTLQTEEIQTMESMAEAVNYLLDQLKIKKCYMIGHSMGGYVTLAFAENYPNKLLGYSLFHSSAKADPEEKKKARDEQIKNIEDGKKEEITANHVPKTFATDNVEKFNDTINKLTEQAAQTTDTGIIAALKGMKARPDRTEILKNTDKPVLFIIGMKDNFIPSDAARKQAELSDKIETVELKNSGHMGFIEEKTEALKAIAAFAQ